MNKARVSKKCKDFGFSYSLLRVVYDYDNKELYGVDLSAGHGNRVEVSELYKLLESYAHVCIGNDYMVQQYRDFKRTIDSYVKEFCKSSYSLDVDSVVILHKVG